jgi:hypothetical protein
MKEGNCVQNNESPSINAERVNVYTTQLTAVRCIHVPISETD